MNFVLEWQFYTDVPKGVDIPVGKNLCEKGNVRKIVQEDFFVAIWQEMVNTLRIV